MKKAEKVPPPMVYVGRGRVYTIVTAGSKDGQCDMLGAPWLSFCTDTPSTPQGWGSLKVVPKRPNLQPC